MAKKKEHKKKGNDRQQQLVASIQKALKKEKNQPAALQIPEQPINKLIVCSKTKELKAQVFSEQPFLDFQHTAYFPDELTFTETNQDSHGPGRKRFLKSQNAFTDNYSEHNFYYAELDQEDKIIQFENMPYRLPDDSRRFIETIRQSSGKKNYGLLSAKAAKFETDKFHHLENVGAHKQLHWQFTASNYSQQFADRHNQAIRKFCERQNLHFVAPAPLTNKWRLTIGLGIESVYETGMCFHPVYGVPYLPASSIKGVVRSYLIQKEWGDIPPDPESKVSKGELAALGDIGFCRIFGSGDEGVLPNGEKGPQQGDVIFFDALPAAGFNITPDVMNPHYGEYYTNDNVPPADWLSPVPIFFLTAENASFQFHWAIRQKDNQQIRGGKWNGQTPAQVIDNHFGEALQLHGMGAKTAVGYGRMIETQ
jgi:CRISPR type III-B/RAMP module RAMP protein Cmr6